MRSRWKICNVENSAQRSWIYRKLHSIPFTFHCDKEAKIRDDVSVWRWVTWFCSTPPWFGMLFVRRIAHASLASCSLILFRTVFSASGSFPGTRIPCSRVSSLSPHLGQVDLIFEYRGRYFQVYRHPAPTFASSRLYCTGSLGRIWTLFSSPEKRYILVIIHHRKRKVWYVSNSFAFWLHDGIGMVSLYERVPEICDFL